MTYELDKISEGNSFKLLNENGKEFDYNWF